MTRAAEQLHVTQPTLSKTMKVLEDELGKKLFTRHSFSIRLTEEGVLLRNRAEDLVSMADRITQEFVTLDEIAEHAGRDRWALSRDFRLLFGTSPYRYLTMRRLDLVRHLLAQGQSLVDAAMTAGFTDQSHMTRQFRSTYGMPPSRWVKMLGR